MQLKETIQAKKSWIQTFLEKKVNKTEKNKITGTLRNLYAFEKRKK